MPWRGLGITNWVVIAIVIAVIAFMIPRLHSVCGPPSRRSVCMNNLRQIGVGCRQYSLDYGDYFPTVRAPGGESRPLASLALLYDNYLQQPRLFTCPSTEDDCSDLQVGKTIEPHSYKKVPGDDRRCSYAYDDTRDMKADPGIVIAGDAPPTMKRYDDLRQRRFWESKRAVPPEGFSEKNSDNHRGIGQNVLFFAGNVKWTNRTENPEIRGDDIYTAADPKNPGANDSYIYQ